MTKNQITITIDLDELGEIDEETGLLVLGDSLQATIQERVVTQFTSRLLGAQHKLIDKTITDQVETAVDTAVRERIAHLLNEPIQKLDSYTGKPKGEPTSVEELTMVAVEQFLSAPASDGRNSYNRGPNLGQMVETTVAEILSKDLKSAISEAKAEISNVIRDKALAGAVAVLSQVK